MALTDNNGGLSAADVAAVMNGRGGNGGFGGWGTDGGWWILLLFLFAMGGWGNNNWGGGGNGGFMPFAMGQTTQADVQRGFDQQATTNALAALQSQIGNGFADAAVARCSGDAAITAAITNGQYATAQAITGAKDTLATGVNSLAMALQNCCCENRAATADLKYTIATEACADRQAVSDGLRDIIANNTANTQALLDSQRQGFQSITDKLCQLELDGFKQKVAEQQAEIAALKGAASQTAQTAQILANNEAQTANLLARLNPNPVPAYMVQNPNCCAPVNYGCGCGA